MDHRDLIDGLLELAVVPSFSSIGIRVRRPLWAWEDPLPGALTGRTAVVTGATGGLGRATSQSLAALGARVVLVGRDAAKLAALAGELAATHGDLSATHGEERFPTVAADLSVLTEVRTAADAIRATAPRLDILVDNAGSIFAERTATVDGLESSMALMAVGPFVLLGGLLPALRASADARVIAVTSGGMYTQPIDVEDLDGEAVAYNGPRFYARAKRAQVALVREWARRTGTADRGSGIAFNAMHPGWARTPGLTDSLPGFDRVMGPILRTPEEGIDTIVWLATAPRDEIGSGRLYLDRRARPFDRAPMTRLNLHDRRRLWDVVVRRSGIADPAPE